MSNKDKHALAEVLRDMADQIVERVGTKDGYMNDIDHLSREAVQEQLNKWLDKLP